MLCEYMLAYVRKKSRVGINKVIHSPWLFAKKIYLFYNIGNYDK